MERFIDRIATFLLQRGDSALLNTTVIFPNRRPIVFLKRALQENISHPVFAPQCFSIRDFVFSLSKYMPADRLTLMFELYRIYLKLHREETSNPYSLEQFIRSGDTMLADFNDIDNEMTDASILFSNLTDAKAIELWNPGKPDLTPREKDYLLFFRSLHKYYEEFRIILREKNLAYDGMAFREVAERCATESIFDKTQFYVLAGFNALTRAERKIISQMLSIGNTEIFWDADDLFVNDSSHEAGVFIRQNIKEFELPEEDMKWSDSNLVNSRKNIQIIGAPLSISQIQFCSQELKRLAPSFSKATDTVVVPCDETLLLPLLESLPPDYESVNVTLGFPLTQSLVYEFVSLYLNMHLRSVYQTGGEKIHYQDFIRFLRHQYFKVVYPRLTYKIPAITDAILKGNIVLYGRQLLKEMFEWREGSEDIHSLLEQPTSPASLIHRTREICQNLSIKISEEEALHKVLAVSLEESLGILEEYTVNPGFQITFRDFEYLFHRLIDTIHIPLEGEPLEGLQLMGMLETRCLDFKNVFILNANEGFLPKGSSQINTFIPTDLRRSFALPLAGHYSAVFSYHFLHLLMRAENIWILYNTEPDGLNGKEMSRYIRQIQYELQQLAGNNWKVSESVLQIKGDIMLPKQSPLPIIKTDFVINRLKKIASDGFSYSRLWDYVECPYKFYMRSILRIEELKSEVEENIESSTLGSIIHAMLEKLYEPAKGKFPDEKFFADAEKRIVFELEQAFDKIYQGGNYRQGKNLLISRVAEDIVRRQLLSDKRTVAEGKKLQFIDNEREVKAAFDTINDIPINLMGKIDRIDSIDGEKRLIDYKTGKLDNLVLLREKKGMAAVLDFSELKSQQFQLLFYLLLDTAENSMKQATLPLAGIIHLKKYTPDFNPLTYSKQNPKLEPELLVDFKIYLKSIFDKIFLSENPFVRTEDIKKCKYCAYAGICNYYSVTITEEDEEA